jgi:hypothetical protein
VDEEEEEATRGEERRGEERRGKERKGHERRGKEREGTGTHLEVTPEATCCLVERPAMLLIRLWRWREREREKKGNGQPTIFAKIKKKIFV